MADKIATRQVAASIGRTGTGDNKLITYEELSTYNCRVIGTARYMNNQCVAEKDIGSNESSITGILNMTSTGNGIVYKVIITGGIYYTYGPSRNYWNYYSSVPNNYIAAGSGIIIKAECAHDGSSPLSEVEFQLSTNVVVDNKEFQYAEKIDGDALFETERISLRTPFSNLPSDGTNIHATYTVHFDFDDTTYVFVDVYLERSTEPLIYS